MRVAVLVLCCLGFAWAEHHHHGRRRNMLDQNRTPRRQTAEGTEDSAGPPENGDVCDLKGAWYNQHGSELILNQTEGGKLIGEFRTGVRLERGGEGQEYTTRRNIATVHGHVFGRLFTFHVYWNEKQAVTTWSGQCQRNCDFGWLRSNRDILHAAWLITSSTSQCDEYWTATRVGEDIFTRLPMKSGPRRADEINTVVETA